MRTLILTIFALTFVAAALPASAENDRQKRDGYRGNDQAGAERLQRKRLNSAEHDRAQGCDPSGQYAAYPDWARSAFTCGGGAGK